MAATHTDYKIVQTIDNGEDIIVTVRYYIGEYKDRYDDLEEETVSQYMREPHTDEEVYTFTKADYTEEYLVEFLNDVLRNINTKSAIGSQIRRRVPRMNPRAVERRAVPGRGRGQA
ncbi:MAG: hypothetical protein CMB80_05625 [Flammeovirgaceae bacterium]|nr:hypothetical protein [Flammeovirgaceae bacterium]|tara:strand:- start:2119 stop:2466 length:348 start_codon:yes stop_codon:yes gene_type:complete